MNAPTDTFIQNLMQGVAPENQAWVFFAIIAAFVVFVMVGFMIADRAAHKRKCREFDKSLSDSQRKERRPAHWGYW